MDSVPLGEVPSPGFRFSQTCFAAFLFLVALGSPAVAPAQTSWTTPDGFSSVEGDSRAPMFGAFPDHRVMLFDGEGAGVRILKHVSFRQDSTKVEGSTRTWRNVSVDVSPCDMSKLSSTFSKNPTRAPTRLFSAQVSWPSVTGTTGWPQPWHYRFPFRAAFVKTGVEDTCLDFDFRGGQVLGTWPPRGAPYNLDGLVLSDYRSASMSTRIHPRHPACKDSAHRFWQASLWFWVSAYRSGPLSGRSEWRLQCAYTARGKPIVFGLGVRGFERGVAFPGITCNPLFLDLRSPTVFVPATAGSTPDARLQLQLGTPRHVRAFEGTPIWIQGMWSDSRTGRPLLTNARSGSYPRMPRSYKRRVLVQQDPAKKHGTGAFVAPEPWFPIMEYGH